ncbi:hypothetical protein RF11_07965 [Thelohanellus kitauei]|uniref:VWFA domain-containing protein n=1 Tax=Thelohanellus kitauei TaxID=669202 RepID=A0A0C2NCN9_THEKT|nr:hypothetical protein RF11_07965 [Thelohanellus kitauei]
MDLAIAIDESKAVHDKYFANQLKFACRLLGILSPKPGHIHAAMMTFSDIPRIVWNLREPGSTDHELAVKRISSITQNKGKHTCLENVIQASKDYIFKRGNTREGVTKVC